MIEKGLFTLLMIFLSSCAIKYGRNSSAKFPTKSTTPQATSYSEAQTHLNQRVQFEQNLKSKREKEQYSEILPLFKNESERIDFLSLPTLEERQEWIKSNRVWERGAENYKLYKSVVEAQDITVGMTQELVRKSWGDPQSVEVSGNPIYKNERWRYTRSVSTPEGFKKEDRLVYFEGGRVVGWETKTN